MEKKNFGLNSDICDMRNIKDGVFDGYEAIYINSDVVIQNERAKEIIAKYPVTLNADTIIHPNNAL